MKVKDFLDQIEKYAEAYQKIEDAQGKYQGIAKGDQKIGVIGEFYAYLYLRYKFPNGEPKLCDNPSEKGWDLKYHNNGNVVRVQVKTVSAYSATRVISPIHKEWDQLFLIYLSRDLKPKGFWIHKNPSICEGICDKGLRGLKMRDPDDPNSGSQLLDFQCDHLSDLKNAINCLSDSALYSRQ